MTPPNSPTTFLGMTVLEPGSEKAPSMPCSDSDGNRHRAISVFTCSEKDEKALQIPKMKM